MKVVLDSNVVLSGFFFAGTPGIILNGWHLGRFRLVLSPSILSEYRNAGIAFESRYRGTAFDSFTTLLALNAEIVNAPEHLTEQVCADPDDDKFLACALSARAGIIVSGDKHLLAVDGWRKIEIMKPRDFVDRYLADLRSGMN